MHLFEYEGKQLFARYGITIPRGAMIQRGDDARRVYQKLGFPEVVVKTQVLAGKRGKRGGIVFCTNEEEVVRAVEALFSANITDLSSSGILIEEKLPIAEEHYLSIIYDTNAKQPLLIYCNEGGVEIEEVPSHKIVRRYLDTRAAKLDKYTVPFVQELWHCFLQEDARLVEINPLVKRKDGAWIAADAKVVLDDDAFFRHEPWRTFPPRSDFGRLPSERENAAKKIDEGEGYYRGTAGKYIELDGDIAVLLSGGGASLVTMDALVKAGLSPANYTEYSGNPPREKVYQLTKVVLSKPGLRGLLIAGGVANFTNIAETFHGIVDALDEIKPPYPIVVRRAGPHEKEGMQLMQKCLQRNGLHIKLFGKDLPISKAAFLLAEEIKQQERTGR